AKHWRRHRNGFATRGGCLQRGGKGAGCEGSSRNRRIYYGRAKSRTAGRSRELTVAHAKIDNHRQRARREWSLGQIWRPLRSRNFGRAAGWADERVHARATGSRFLARTGSTTSRLLPPANAAVSPATAG